MTAVITGFAGTPFAKMAAYTLPLIEAYALRHGAVFGCANMIGERAPSWQKVSTLHKTLQKHDLVVWIDIDVVVLDGSRWIGDELPADKWQGLVEHKTECGEVPNCGVWVVRREMLPVLEQVWQMDRYLDHGWWEQAAVLELLGYHVTAKPTAKRERPSDLYDRTHWLGSEWNDHPDDTRRAEHARLVHVTQYADRLATVKRYAALAT